ncbi:MAG: corrinoid protein [Bryobacteraceae bacterium]|jgi:corrinoid protein of di/trimethylamine methyltransferase
MADDITLYDAIVAGDTKAAVTAARTALDEGVDPVELVSRQMIPAMDEVGRLFACEEYFVPELLLAARAMKGALGLVRPLLASSGVEPVGRVVIGTVMGDLHDIGKNLVASMLEGAGFEIIDLGADVTPARFIQAIQEKKADIACLSALLTVTMPAMRETIEAIRQAGIRNRVKVLVGGAPVTQQYADKIGADGYSDNASGAVSLARKLMGISMPKGTG